MELMGFLALLSNSLFLVKAEDPWWLKVAQRQGPMVCAEEHVDGQDRIFSTPWTGGNLCGSETIVRYSCCPGYGRAQGERGCPLVKPLKNLAETAAEMGAKQYVKHAEQSGLLPLLTNSGAYTIFVARDKAFKSLTKEQEKALNSSKKSRSRPPALLYTLVEGRITSEELPDSLPTLYREGSVTVTRFPSGLITMNCIPLVATNIEATNGLIHVTESLMLSTGRNTVTDLIARSQTLSTTASALTKAQLSNELRDKRPITIFSPTDEAWESLPQPFMEALMEDASALKVLLQYHIVELVWCTAISAGKSELKTLEGGTLQVFCNDSGQYVNNARIVQGDFTSRNGFLHHIDAVLIPEKVRSLAEQLKSRKLNYFRKLTEIGGILPLFQRQDIYTIFAPTDDAFEALPNETISELFEQPSLARAVAGFHVTTGRYLMSSVIDGQTFNTIQGSESILRIKIHKKRVTVETALITEVDLKARNGVLQIIDRVITPPATSIVEQLAAGNFSIFSGLLNQTDPNLLKLLDNSTATFTVFAPSDGTLNTTLPPSMIQRLLLDPPLLYKTMARHILPIFLVSSYMDPKLTYSYKTISDEVITVSKDSYGSVTVANLAEVTVPDISTKNGILHEISRMIQF